MLKTTSQQLIDSLGYEGDRVGQPLVLGVAIDQTNQSVSGALGDLLEVPKGSVFLITHIVLQIDQSSHIGVRVTSPSGAESLTGFEIKDGAGTVQSGMYFRGFARYRTIFTGGGGSPDFRAAQPGEVITWEPKYPIQVPSGWSIDMPQSPIAWGHQGSVYGVMVSESSARQMGYQVSDSTTDADRRSGIASSLGSTSAAAIIPARVGKCIKVLDVHIRSQPETVGSNTFTIQQDDDTPIYTFINDNPAELINQSFSPGWFLKANTALEVISDKVGTCSVNIVFEYVDEDKVPGNAWFASIKPNLPTPGTGAVGTGGLARVASSEVTLYYAKPDASGSHTRTSPLKGFQHMLNGYSVFIQKTATTENAVDDTNQTKLAISTGASAGGIAFGLIALSQSNLQLSPAFSGSGHDQCTWSLVEGLNLPCKKDDGSLWIDTIGFDGAGGAPGATDIGVRDWAVNLWGRTAPSQFSPRTNQGT